MINIKAIFLGFVASLVAMIVFAVLHLSPFLTGWLSCLVYTLTFNYFEENDKMQG
jgi:hypothetical protein